MKQVNKSCKAVMVMIIIIHNNNYNNNKKIIIIMYEQKQQSPFEFSQSIIIISNKTIYY